MTTQRPLTRLALTALALVLLAAAGTPTAHAEPDPAAPTYLSTVIIYTPDMQKLADFYRLGLGLGEPATVLENHIGFWLGNNYLGFEPVATITTNPGGPTAWFGVADAAAALADLVAAGARAELEPTPQPWGDVHATARDPDGNLVGLIQRGESD